MLTEGVPRGDHVVLAVGDGATLLAFATFEDVTTTPVELPPGCEEARWSWAMGDHVDAWRGDRVHLRLDGRELWIGVADAAVDMTFAISAGRHDGTRSARFGRFDGILDERWNVTDGGRLAAGYPPHFVVEAEFDAPGCWEVRVTGEDLDETVLLPVPTASPP